MRTQAPFNRTAHDGSTAGDEVRTCLLCGGGRCTIHESFSSDDLRKAWTALGVTFSAHAWGAMNGRPTVDLFKCGNCGFRFCDPHLAGDGRFYRELDEQRADYYPAEVPEFSRTLEWARRHKLRTVLDIGSGDGAFLDLARTEGMGTAGVELNQKAAEACQRKGHQAYTRPVPELIREEGARYDLVTLFQVVEHVPNPVEFLSQASALLRQGGFVAVAVPNDRGIYRLCPHDPHEWPPHHITRWRQADLRRLGARCGLKVVRTGANRLLGSEAEHFWRLHNQISVRLGHAPHPGGSLLPAALSFFYRKLGMKFILPGLGTSVYAFYQHQ